MSKPLCIYHANCADGFTSAWIVRKYFKGDVDFHPGVYQQEPPNWYLRDVIMVDFSYKRPVIESMFEPNTQAMSCLILDHHKSAAEDLSGLKRPHGAYDPRDWRGEWESWGVEYPLRAVFDMGRSGAGLTWDFFFPNQPRPRLVDYVEDRDLWKFRFPETRNIQANVFSYPYDFEVWDKLADEIEGDRFSFAAQGAAIERKHHKDIAELVGVTKRRMVIGGHDVPVANLPYTLTSDAGHLMARGEPFAACYWDTPKGRVFSLRSTDAGMDVSAIAASYGGGGHRNASGFTTTLGWEGDLKS